MVKTRNTNLILEKLHEYCLLINRVGVPYILNGPASLERSLYSIRKSRIPVNSSCPLKKILNPLVYYNCLKIKNYLLIYMCVYKILYIYAYMCIYTHTQLYIISWQSYIILWLSQHCWHFNTLIYLWCLPVYLWLCWGQDDTATGLDLSAWFLKNSWCPDWFSSFVIPGCDYFSSLGFDHA